MDFWQQVIVSLFTVVFALVGMISYQQRVEKKNGNSQQIVEELKRANEKLSNIDKHLSTEKGVSQLRYDNTLSALGRIEEKVNKT